MADDEVTPQAGELTTANYGWVKPTVGDSDDAWGGMINTDLDGIDSTVKSVSNAIPAASSTTPVMSGAGAVGAGTTWARADHQHPSDTSRYATSNPSGYQTAAQVTAALPVASSTTPLMDGTAAVGVGTTWARADHVHPTDVHAIGDNRIINGDMRIDQRNNGASGTANGYVIDRWRFDGNVAGRVNRGQNITGVAAPKTAGFPYYFGGQGLATTYALLAGDFFVFTQNIEADMVSDFAWGTSSAQPVTLSFWAYASITGTFGGAIENNVATRSYPFTYSIPVANSWMKIVVTIPGDTSGTWVLNGNVLGMALILSMGAGTTYSGPANAWASAYYMSANGAVNVQSVASGAFLFTGVKLEIGSVATPYNRQSLAKSLADCQRYYSTQDFYCVGYSNAGNPIGGTITLPVLMRAAPTIAFSGAIYNNSSGVTLGNASSISPGIYASVTATGAATAHGIMTAAAEL